MGLGAFKVRWADRLELALGVVLELVGVLPRETCGSCSRSLAPTDGWCARCGTRRGEERGT